MSLDNNHKALIRETLRSSGNARSQNDSAHPRKRRKKAVPLEVVEIDSESTDDFEDVDLEDVDLLAASSRELTPMPTEPEPTSAADSDDSDDFDDLEDVDFDAFLAPEAEPTSAADETLTFAIGADKEEEKTKKKKRAFVPISKEERAVRKSAHKLILFAMLCHGAVRNRWCSEPRLLHALRRFISPSISDLFHQDNADVLDYVKARRFIDGLRKMVLVFSRKFKVNMRGLARHDWGCSDEDILRPVSFHTFQGMATSFKGSRDIAAQLFVALLRSVGVDARLVFSIQVPDYRSLKPVKSDSLEPEPEEDPQEKPKSEFDPVFIPNPRQALLAGVRSRRHGAKEATETSAQAAKSSFPVFWVEAWNKYSNKWITIDPVVFKVVEVMPMRRKCKFEAPSSDQTHQTWYVIAYDQHGTATDVTRRYTQYYNAKTAKRRIGFASEEDAHWYNRILRSVSRAKKITRAEAVELKEFYDRHVCEGFPNNKEDFKNHPVYALSSQLRQDEVIYPDDDSSKCGMYRSSNKKSNVTVYKRSHVHPVKTAKAWHMKGRVLKVGAQPLKTKKVPPQFADDGEDESEARLYAEFQTELYKPPPIVDGKITKNAFGNVEIFAPTMIPENASLIEVTKDITMKMLENAARSILRIEYAKAIVSFEFGKGQKGQRSRGAATAREGGILVESIYRDGVLAVIEGLKEQEEETKRLEIELNALRSWKFFLKKLQIVKRLNRQHGKLEDEAPSGKAEDEDEEEAYFSVASDEQDSDNENYVPRPSRRRKTENVDYGGGFLPAEGEYLEDGEEGGFFNQDLGDEEKMPSENFDQEGGFFTTGDDPEGGFFPEKGSRSDPPSPANQQEQQKGDTHGDAFDDDVHSEAGGFFLSDDEKKEKLKMLEQGLAPAVKENSPMTLDESEADSIQNEHEATTGDTNTSFKWKLELSSEPEVAEKKKQLGEKEPKEEVYHELDSDSENDETHQHVATEAQLDPIHVPSSSSEEIESDGSSGCEIVEGPHASAKGSEETPRIENSELDEEEAALEIEYSESEPE